MFFLFDPRFEKFLRERFGYDLNLIMKMRDQMLQMITAIQINETFVYLDEKGLSEEEAELENFSEVSASAVEQSEALRKIYERINQLMIKYPELNDRVEKKLRELNSDMAEKFFTSLDDDSLVAVSEFFVEDIKNSNELKQKFPQSNPKLQ